MFSYVKMSYFDFKDIFFPKGHNFSQEGLILQIWQNS